MVEEIMAMMVIIIIIIQEEIMDRITEGMMEEETEIIGTTMKTMKEIQEKMWMMKMKMRTRKEIMIKIKMMDVNIIETVMVWKLIQRMYR